jgi:hypothetical protein
VTPSEIEPATFRLVAQCLCTVSSEQMTALINKSHTDIWLHCKQKITWFYICFLYITTRNFPFQHHSLLFLIFMSQFLFYMKLWRTESWNWVRGVFKSLSSLKFWNFDKPVPNSQFRGKHISIDLIRIWGSLVCNLNRTSVFPLSYLNLLNPTPGPKQNSRVRHWSVAFYEYIHSVC